MKVYRNLVEMACELNLSVTCLSNLVNGTISSTKGYYLAPPEEAPISVVSKRRLYFIAFDASLIRGNGKFLGNPEERLATRRAKIRQWAKEHPERTREAAAERRADESYQRLVKVKRLHLNRLRARLTSQKS